MRTHFASAICGLLFRFKGSDLLELQLLTVPDDKHIFVAAFAVFDVSLHDDVAEVTQYNSVTHPADKSETAVSTRMGLGLCRDRLLHIGGMLRTEVEDGTWMLYARVPLTHQT